MVTASVHRLANVQTIDSPRAKPVHKSRRAAFTSWLRHVRSALLLKNTLCSWMLIAEMAHQPATGKRNSISCSKCWNSHEKWNKPHGLRDHTFGPCLKWARDWSRVTMTAVYSCQLLPLTPSKALRNASHFISDLNEISSSAISQASAAARGNVKQAVVFV